MSAPTPRPLALPKARNTADVQLPNVSVLYLGPPKSGKTTCALSWPDPFVFNFEPNLAGLLGADKVPYLTVDDMGPDVMAKLQGQILPAIAAGRIGEITDKPVRTLVFDSLTVLLGGILAGKISNGTTLTGYDQFGTFLYQAENFISGQLTPLVRRGFNVVATCHLAEYGGESIMQKDERGRLVPVGAKPTYRRPQVPGAFRNVLCSKFDSILLTGSELVRTKVTEKGVDRIVTEPSYYVETINPDRSYEGIGDGLGRKGGRFRPLPPKLDGRYPALAKAWGLPE